MRVTLNEANHTYTDEQGQYYKSVSAIIADYKEPFDPYKIMWDGGTLIGNYVKKNGYTEQYWLDQWTGKRDYACEKGHVFHSLKELAINHQPYHKVERKFLPVQNINHYWNINRHKVGYLGDLPAGVYTELCIWNTKAMTAGTADKVTIYEDRTFDIKDYKTNGVFKTESFNCKIMKFPCHELMDCHLGHYTLQLNLYAFMLAQFGLTPRELMIEHYDIPERDVTKIVNQGILPDIEPTLHEVAYDEQLARTVMKQQAQRLNYKRK